MTSTPQPKYGVGSRYGEGPEETGLNRLALTSTDKEVREWFTSTTESLGCKVFVDEIGNQFAIRPGLKSYTENHGESGKAGLNILNVPATFAGSHLDSQPQGGRFDGVLGVCAGIEMLRVLEDNWIETEGPVGVVNWTNEEGKRWKRSMMGSAVWSDGTKEALQSTWALEDTDEAGNAVTVKKELESIGYVGSMRASAIDGIKMAGHFELHIEQGKRLERANQKVAVVSGVQGYKWLTVTIIGEEGHAGATMWEDRSDAMLLSSLLIQRISAEIRQQGGLVTFGCLEALPGSVNVIAGKVRMTVDVRFGTKKDLEKGVETINQLLHDTLASTPRSARLRYEVKQDFANDPMEFDPFAMTCVKESANSVTEDDPPALISGAGHDSVNTAKHCPTAMIFVPCREGITHNVREWCSEEDCAIGASVLLQSVLRFDAWRHQQGHFA